jgi:hypothetical protein
MLEHLEGLKVHDGAGRWASSVDLSSPFGYEKSWSRWFFNWVPIGSNWSCMYWYY